MRRDDLLALDANKLAALSNRGLVKRAIKDVTAGRGPSITVEDDGAVVAKVADVVTRLDLDAPLRETSCTCPALDVCRHRVMAVIAYQRAVSGGEDSRNEGILRSQAPWSPGTFDDDALRERLGRAAYARAIRRRRVGYAASVRRSADGPAVELPTCTVRFLIPGSLGYARCDCRASVDCEHVALAVWAFRRADEQGLTVPRVTVEVGEAGGAGERAGEPVKRSEILTSRPDVLEPIVGLGRELVLDGAVGSSEALAARFSRVKRSLRRHGFVWLVSLLEDLERALEGYAMRAAAYRPELVGDLVTELHARALAARGDGELPPRTVLGLDEPGETRLEHVHLVSLGARLRAETTGAGATATRARVTADVHLVHPHTLDVLVLRKRWELSLDALGPEVARRSVLSGVTLGDLARGQLVTQVAKRRANRQLVLGRGGLGRTSVTPQRGDWDGLGAPLFVRDVSALERALRDRAPSVLRPRLLADRVHVFAIETVGAFAYSAAEQTFRADLHDPRGRTLRVELGHSIAAPRAVDALASALAGRFGPPRFVSGEVRREGEHLVMVPLSVVAHRVVVLDLEAIGPAVGTLPYGQIVPSEDPIHEVLTEARAHLDAGAHQGLRHVTSSWRDRLLELAERLARVGLSTCAERARGLHRQLAACPVHETAASHPVAVAWLDASLQVRLCLEATA